MSQANQRTIKQAIGEMLKAYRLDGKLAEVRLVQSWEKVMGVMIARHTAEVSVRNKKLYVRLDSAALRQELSYGREKILNLLNEEAGTRVIEDIVFQ